MLFDKLEHAFSTNYKVVVLQTIISAVGISSGLALVL